MRRTLAVLLAVNTLNIYDRVALSALTEPIRREFHLSDAQVGLLSTGFIIVYALAGVPLGRLADRGSRRKLLAAGVAVWALLTASAGWAANYLMLLISRLGVGIGESVCAPTGTSWLGDVTPPDRRGRAMAIFMLGAPFGSTLASVIGGPAAQAFGWRVALMIAAAPALLLVPMLLCLPEPAVKTAPQARGAWDLLRSSPFRWIVLSGALLNFNLYTTSAFIPAFMTRYHGLSVAQSGLWSGIAIGAAGVLGGAVAAAGGDRVGGAAGRMRMAAAASLLAAPVVCVALWERAGSALALPVLAGATGLLSMYYGLVYAAIQDLVEPARRASAMAVYFLAMYLCGGAFGPLITGRTSDWLAARAAAQGLTAEAARAAGLHDALYLVALLSVALAAVLWVGARRITAAGQPA